jgi:hypothetical protein
MLIKKLEDLIINYSRIITSFVVILALLFFVFYSFSFTSIFFDKADYKGIDSPMFIDKENVSKKPSSDEYNSATTSATHFNKLYYVLNEYPDKINQIINLIYPVYIKSGYVSEAKREDTLAKLNKSFVKHYQKTVNFLENDKYFSSSDDKSRNKILNKYIEDFLIYTRDWSKFYISKNDKNNSALMDSKYKLEVIKIIASGGPIKEYNEKFKQNVRLASYDYAKSLNIVENNKKSLLEIILYISISFGVFITAIIYILFFRIDESLRIKK